MVASSEKLQLSLGLREHTNIINGKRTTVYECKTCNKTFSTSQGLGGHRACHRLHSKTNNESIIKVHKCSKCGSTFKSGQALGGHMSRHRALVETSTSSKPKTFKQNDQPTKKRNVLPLDVDLNLPAAHGDGKKETKFALASKQPEEEEQTSVVFSAPSALVDCHQ